MLAAQVLRDTSKPTAAAPRKRRGVPDRARVALRNWRVIGDKLCSLVFWGPLHNAVTQFLEGVAKPAFLPKSRASSSTTVALAPTSKAEFYKAYISREPAPETMTNVKVIPEESGQTCRHEARYLKGCRDGG